jgi:RimK family alpha-L-glutamate ligase
MKNRIITFTMSLKQSQFEVDRVAEEAVKLGVEVTRALYRELSFKINNGKTEVMVKGEKVDEENTKGLWFRVAGTKSGKYTEGRNLAIRILQDRVFCCNHEGYLKWTRMGKIAQHGVFVEAGIPVVPSRVFYTKDQVVAAVEEMEKEFGWPIIAKHEKGYQGKSVRKFENREELLKFVKKINEKNLGMFMWQKCLPTRSDLRVVVLGGRAIGGMKRSAVGGEFRSNYSLGGKVERWQLNEEERQIAEEVARVCGLDYCGVDIMKDENGGNYVLEVNRQCQFKGFEESTGINVAKSVVEMLINGRR